MDDVARKELSMWKALVVDDNFVGRKLLTEVLKGRAQCDNAANGKEALEAYQIAVKEKTPYDIILLDIAMPDMSGVEVLEKIRQDEESRGIQLGKGVPVIMVTAHREPLCDSFNKGCDDYILKPIQADALIKKIEEKVRK